jgi:adenylate cyclase
MMEVRNYLRGHNIKDTREARRIAEEAMAMCSENPIIYVLMGSVHQMEYWVDYGKSPRESTEKGIEMIQKALAMDDSLAIAHSMLGHLYLQKREYDKAVAEAERAVALDLGGEGVHTVYATLLYYAGRPEEAIPVFQKAIRLSPLGSTSTFLHLGHTYRVMGRFEEALSAYKKALQLAPDNIFAHLGLVTTYIMMGREKEARVEAAEVLRINPKFSVDSHAKILMNKNQSVVDNAISTWRKAGLK